ncbi:MAG: sugar transporter substrate-binding protein [Sphingomonas bacterium]|uniref:ABC transporter substrate-binding protein n=1 Tax=Sphingomonas bacterium TaxID=1895847 RepID=UPI00263414CB|nr:extracellular solute-binding protein [Sphingomonas bacterium]MDB5711574.1 sugar transporter substrate-binding protein [Sphingomonas bacterium]
MKSLSLRSALLLPLTALSLMLGSCSKKPDAEPTSLVVWQTETDPRAKAVLDEVAGQFERDNPGVKVSIESVPWGALSEKLTTALKSDAPPDVAHLEPFMTYSLVERGLLSPIDDVVADIQKENGPIFPAVLDLQLFDEHRYGIAYAVGVTGWTFDMRKANGAAFPYPAQSTSTISEDALFSFLADVKRRNPKATVLLPGGTPFFMDQLFGELVANAGGRLYDPATRQFLLTSEPAKRALRFFVRLRDAGMLSPDWQGQQYADQFSRLAGMGERGDIFLTPVTYARASVAIEKTLATNLSQANATNFRFMSAPTNQLAGPSVATIDCEPFVIFSHTEKEKGVGNLSKRDLAARFLRAFYKRKNYLKFVSTVPIHLTPIFSNLAQDPAYLSSFRKEWRPWHDRTLTLLSEKRYTRPILVPGPDNSTLEEDLRNPYLLPLQAQGIISHAITEALAPGADIDKILTTAQAAAMRLVDRQIQPARAK